MAATVCKFILELEIVLNKALGKKEASLGTPRGIYNYATRAFSGDFEGLDLFMFFLSSRRFSTLIDWTNIQRTKPTKPNQPPENEPVL